MPKLLGCLTFFYYQKSKWIDKKFRYYVNLWIYKTESNYVSLLLSNEM